MIARLSPMLIVLAGVLLLSLAGASAQTVETGDRLMGVPVIQALDAASLPPGRHHFFFETGGRSTGQVEHVPVIVIRGAAEGTRLLLTAAVHGDELNGIGVIHRLMEAIDPQQLSGTLIAVPGLNQPGILINNRRFPTSGGGGSLVDLNREFPGSDEAGGSAAKRYLGALWNGLIKPNADFAVDLHTQTRGSAYPLFVFADFGTAAAKKAAFLLGPDMIKNDAGEEGTLETSLVAAGIPAITFEVGAPKRFQHTLISRAVEGLQNLMRHHGMLEGDAVKPAVTPIVGSSYTNVYAETGGVAVVHVALKQAVKKGDVVATLYNPFGEAIKRYEAPHDGWVLAVATDPMRETGSMLVRILR